MSSDKTDIITGINVHCGFFLDCLKVKYKNQIGTPTGNEQGGNAYTIRGLDEKYNYIVGVNVHFRERVISGIQFVMSDGQTTQIFGNGETNQKTTEIKCGPIGYNNDFKLVGIQMAESKATEHFNLCVGHIYLIFEH
ncbi:2041_t:CDS:1, partial [Racocetra persica]